MLKTYALAAALLASAATLPLATAAQASPQASTSSSPEHSQHHPAGADATAAGSGSDKTASGQMAPSAGMSGQGGMMEPGGMMGLGGMMDMRRMMEMMGGRMPMMGMMGPGGMQMGMGTSGVIPGMMFEHMEGRLAFLRTELGITEAQMPEWNAYAEAARKSAETMRSMHESMRGSRMPTTWPERLERHESILTARLEALRQTRDAASDLYEVLSQDQKQTADSLMPGPMGAM